MVNVTKVKDIVERHGGKKEHLIAILQDCQDEYYYLPREMLEELSNQIQVPLTAVLSIATCSG